MILATLLAGATLAAPATELKITVWPNGVGQGSRTRTLRCAPAGGTLPGAAAACTRLLAREKPFAPVPAETACTTIYGGPQEALVQGTVRGARVWARFRRTDGCQIARWERVRFLFR